MPDVTSEQIASMKKKIDKKWERERSFLAEIKADTKKMQEACLHPKESWVEGTYTPEGLYVSVRPPFRVCVECGYAEEGWAFTKLKGYDISTVSRDEARKLIYGRLLLREEQ